MLKVEDVYRNITLKPSLVNAEDTLDVVKEKIARGSPVNRSVYVVNRELSLLGIITLQELLRVLAVNASVRGGKKMSKGKLLEFISKDTLAEDIMIAPVSVSTSDSLTTALELFMRHSLEELPVVDETGKVIGDLDAYELIAGIDEKNPSHDPNGS
ncbi:CBS domain-containing protein [Marinococcus halotolerans]|uniref:CBS domain-containing protein n=1 Tax=Marinococcus halotolerans TaxID=301092 RepID=UPI0003B3118A|nr:CBS domain-containing protein [Marinococcus halotolerans]